MNGAGHFLSHPCYSPVSFRYDERQVPHLREAEERRPVGGREVYKGPPPASGTELEVPLLRGGTVKARIGSSNTEERGGFAGTLVTEIIYADEI